MKKITEFAISLRYITSKRKEKFISINGFFSLFGIALGVATLIIVMSVMNGFRTELVKRILGINAHVTILSDAGGLAQYSEVINKISENVAVKNIYPIVDAEAMAIVGDNAKPINIKGIEYSDLPKKELIYSKILRGDIAEFEQKDAIILGDKLALKLGVEIGEKVRVIAPKTSTTILGVIPKVKDYRLVATFEVGMHEYDNIAAFANLSLVQKQFDYQGKISAIEVIGHDLHNTEKLAGDITKLMFENDWFLRVYDWQKINASFINALKVERNVMFLIVSLIIIVAAFNIISSLVMLVHDKKKNIALLRSMGMRRVAILRIFIYCGALIGCTGTVLGVLLGSWFSYNIDGIKRFLESLTGSKLFDPVIYFLTDLPSEISPHVIVYIACFSVLVTLLASIYPAWKAAKSEPAEIMRYE